MFFNIIFLSPMTNRVSHTTDDIVWLYFYMLIGFIMLNFVGVPNQQSLDIFGYFVLYIFSMDPRHYLL